MGNTTKIWLVIATSLVMVGCLILGGVMAVLHWDLSKLSTVKYETNHHEIREEFRHIAVEADTADVTFVLSEDGECRVDCYEERKEKHAVTVENDTLVIKLVNEKSWYDYIGINIGSPKITVYLPKGEYGALSICESTADVALSDDFRFESVDISLSTGSASLAAPASGLVKIQTSTGNIRVQNISAGALDLSASTGGITVSDVICSGDTKVVVSTGKAKLNNVTCKNLSSGGDTGGITLDRVVAAETVSLKRNTGDVRFNGCDAAEIFVTTDTGDVTGRLLTDKVFITHTDTGRVEVPKTVTGGRCEITTDTGDIRITVE